MQQVKYGEPKGSDSEDSGESSPKVCERQRSTNRQFEEAFRSVITTNKSGDVVDGIGLLIKLASPLLQFTGKSKTYGVERSIQYKYRTILSQNTQVNNMLLSLKGNIEDVIFAMGYRAIESGNTSLKPNFYFKHVEPEQFDHLMSCINHMSDFLQAVANNSKPKLDQAASLARPLSQITQTTQACASVSKPLTLQEMRKKQVPAVQCEESKSETQQHVDTLGRADGKRIFINKLEFYPSELPAPLQEHTIRFNQLMFKNLIEKGPVDVKTAVFNTMIFDQQMLGLLFIAKVPITVFMERAKTCQGPLVESNDDFNTNLVYQKKAGPGLDYGCFHSKLILYEFDDRLRVVVSSSNLYQHDWYHMSQVIWFQDFYRKSLQPMREFTPDSEFQKYLAAFIQLITPLEPVKVFRKQISLSDFDFSEAQVLLVGSVAGRFGVHDKTKIKLGQNRLKEICNPENLTTPFMSKQKVVTKKMQIVFQTSSVGNLKPGFILDMYKSFTNHLTQDFKSQISILFPTEEHVEDSHLGVAQASSIIMQAKFWDGGVLPKECFCGQKARYKEVDGNLYHSKWIVALDQSEEGNERVTNDSTSIYIGSHNLSQAAWGGYEKNGAQITIFNCELGVVFGPKVGSSDLKKLILSILPLEVLNPPKYDEKIDRPFIMEKQKIYRLQVDQ